jgi:hypothetical protein
MELPIAEFQVPIPDVKNISVLRRLQVLRLAIDNWQSAIPRGL